MVSSINVVVSSDLSGKPEAETVEFGWSGKNYQIDLTAEEKTKFESVIQVYLKASHGAPAKASTKPVSRAAAVGLVPSTVRAWATSNNVEIPKRGRIPENVILLFQEAHVKA